MVDTGAWSTVLFGDIVVSVNGARTDSESSDQVEALLEGMPGSKVVLVVRRGGMERVLTLERVGGR